jgi:hypothetical protein
MGAAGIAKKAYDVARRPENQAKIRQATERFRQGRGQGGASQGGAPQGAPRKPR